MGCACGPFLWYTLHRRWHTGCGNTGGGNEGNNRVLPPETAADSAAARKEHAELNTLSPMARDEKTVTVLNIRISYGMREDKNHLLTEVRP